MSKDYLDLFEDMINNKTSILENRRGGQVSKKNALSENKMSKSWKNI